MSGWAGVHATALVQGAELGPDVEVLQFAVVRAGARVGAGTRVCSHAYVDAGVIVGRGCKVKNHAFLCEGVVLEDGVFVGPGATFTNDRHPRASRRARRPFPRTVVRTGATIGAGAVILPGVEIGAGATVAAGAVVVRDVPPGATVAGNPARVLRQPNEPGDSRGRR